MSYIGKRQGSSSIALDQRVIPGLSGGYGVCRRSWSCSYVRLLAGWGALWRTLQGHMLGPSSCVDPGVRGRCRAAEDLLWEGGIWQSPAVLVETKRPWTGGLGSKKEGADGGSRSSPLYGSCTLWLGWQLIHVGGLCGAYWAEALTVQSYLKMRVTLFGSAFWLLYCLEDWLLYLL
ncbi:hypothetical protein GOP47_0021801 [Adiantum capillus-veneris]|uniref:Uncharacterized protein n=1 Tax=Adiantum capillus-veneris TaxID=13818 RepID=A0A9D4U9W8_ADICA|nr:hypothetical protein GOP47_0021801 [Adiantum capillus-veneris]